jgi:hypothetical protein
VLTNSAGFMRARSSAVTMPRGVVQAQVQAQHIGLFKEGVARFGRHVAVRHRLGAAGFAAPDHHLHAERAAQAGHRLADLAVAPDAQRAALEHKAQPVQLRVDGGRLPQPSFKLFAYGTILRAAAMISAQVSSAGAVGEPTPSAIAMPVPLPPPHPHGRPACRSAKSISNSATSTACAVEMRAFADQDQRIEGRQPDRQLAQPLVLLNTFTSCSANNSKHFNFELHSGNHQELRFS